VVVIGIRRARASLVSSRQRDQREVVRGRGIVEIGGHDTLMGAALLASGVLTIAYTRAASNTLKMLTLIGAAATLVIGFLLFFHLA
jgi:hypothetical protein